MSKQVSVTIDGTQLTVPEGTLVVEAAKLVQTDVPVYCYHPKLGPAGLCRICLVEIEKAPKLQIACNTAVTEGMVVHTYGPKVEEGRRAVLEFLLLNHPLDCPICDKGGECDLQDFSMAYGQGASRLADPKAQKPKAIDLGPTIVLDDERCIVCQRCTRFDELITHERSLVVKDRGQRDVISTASGEPYVSNFSGNVTELCPVGALTSKTYRFKSRPWDLHRTETTCTQCSVGCAINVDVRHGDILRTMSKHDDDTVSDGWLCDRGRYNIGFYADARRLTSPLLRHDGQWLQIGWDDAIEMWAKAFREATASNGPSSLAILGGANLTSEELALLRALAKSLGITNLDWRTGRQRQASVGAYAGTYADLDAAQMIVTLGRPPAQTAPVFDLRIRKAVAQRNAVLATVGDHPAGSFVPGLHVAHLSDLASRFDGVERIAFVWDGIDMALGHEAADVMAALVARGAHVSGFIPGESSNALGAEAFGILPHDSGLDTGGIFGAAREGTIRALALFGANPMLQHPLGGAAVRAALEHVPFVVATDLFLTETAALANLVLPVKGPFEKAGHTYDLTGGIHELAFASLPPEGVLSDGEIIVALAAELGVAVPAPDELETLATASPTSSASGFGDLAICGPTPPQAAVAKGSASSSGAIDLRLAIAAHIFAGAASVANDALIAGLRPQASAIVAPETARALDVNDGDLVDVVAGDRTLPDLAIRIVADATPGTLAVIDGLSQAPANAFTGGEAIALANVRPARALAGSTV